MLTSSAVVAAAGAAGLGVAQVTLLTTHITRLVTYLGIDSLGPYTDQNLFISESFVLIWHDDDSGKTSEDIPLVQKARSACLLAAFIFDLIGQKRIALEPDAKKKEKLMVIVKDPRPVGNYLDKLFDKIKNSEKPKTLKKLIFSEHMSGAYLEESLDFLVDRGVLRKDVSKKFKFFSNTKYTTLKPEVKINLRDKIRDAILNNAAANPNTLALLGIILETDELYGWKSSLLPILFTKEELPHAVNNLRLRVGLPSKPDKK